MRRSNKIAWCVAGFRSLIYGPNKNLSAGSISEEWPQGLVIIYLLEERGGGGFWERIIDFFGKLTANELPMRGGESHKKISEPSWGSGKFYGDNQNPPTPYWLAQFFCLCKIYSCLLTPKCTRYHVVTSTNKLTSVFDQIFPSLKANVVHWKGYQSHVETSQKWLLLEAGNKFESYKKNNHAIISESS